MSFEVDLRERLQREAASVPLPGRDPRIAASRAKTIRHRRQLTAAGMVILSAALVVGAPLLLANQSEDRGSADFSTGQGFGLPATGPVELDWQTHPDGLAYPTKSFETADGVVYALSTAPGRGDPGQEVIPRALYRLGEDGTWEPVVVDDEGSQIADLVAGEDGLLYAVGTGPASDGEGTMASLSASGDGGATWTTNLEVEPAAPPSDVAEWESFTDVGIATNGSTTLAAVTTSFTPKFDDLFPQMEGPDAENLTIEMRAEGVVLVRFDPVAPAVDAQNRAGADGSPVVMPPPEAAPVVDTVTWQELGIDGQQAMSTTQLFALAGDGWQDVSSPEFAGAGASSLTTAAGGFTAIAYGERFGNAATTPTVLTSQDGTTWSPIETPVAGDVVGFGAGALANVKWFDGPPAEADGPLLSVSTDAGATWTEVNLADAGMPPDMVIYSADGGPLGLALLVGPSDMATGGPEQLLFTGDLVDWTAADLTDVTGMDEMSTFEVLVGENQVLVTASFIAERGVSATAVGTPLR